MSSYTELIKQLEELKLEPLGEPLGEQSAPGVCYVYDEEMTKHAGDKSHPERPERIRTIHTHLKEAGLLDDRVCIVESRLATIDELCLAHTRELVDKVISFEMSSELLGTEAPTPTDVDPVLNDHAVLVKQKKFLFPFDSDTYICHATPRAARLACGSVLSCVDALLGGVCVTGFAAIRPPGHHALRETSMGYCLFNNVAVAANYARSKHGVNRVAILDWDVHHGNGTASIFDSDPHTLFMSIHRHDRGTFYPGTGHFTHTGTSKRNVNMSIDGSFGDEEILHVFEHIVMPSLHKFGAEIILVSAGFDAAENDPLGGCRVRTGTYGNLTQRLMELKVPLLLVLEGGYNLGSVADASVACMRALLQDSKRVSPRVFSPCVSSSGSSCSSIRSVGPGRVKSSVIDMTHALSLLLRENGLEVPIAPHRSLKNLVHVPGLGVAEFVLSGGGHEGGVVRLEGGRVMKRTTQREALAYLLISEASGAAVCKTVGLSESRVGEILAVEKLRVNFERNLDFFAQLAKNVSVCEQVKFVGEEGAEIVLEDITAGLDQVSVLDMKLGTEYHLPEDGPNRVQTRRQKAASTSAASLGIRVTACRGIDGLEVSKRKARKLRTLTQMAPLIRRVCSEISAGETFVESIRWKDSPVKFIASSVLFVTGLSATGWELRCKLIDLAHMYPKTREEPDGFQIGCQNLALLLAMAKEPSYEPA